MGAPRHQDFFFFEGFDLAELLKAAAWRMSAWKADSPTSSPSWMSIARRTFPSRLELKSRAGSFSDAPLANVSFTTFLYVSPVQMMPSCDHTGMPHFHSSTASGSAALISLRILLRVFPRQSPSSAILSEISTDGDWPWLALEFFMFSYQKFQSAYAAVPFVARVRMPRVRLGGRRAHDATVRTAIKSGAMT